jgi:hypothetical protein
MHQAWGLQTTRYYSAWANLYRYSIYTGSTVYTTPVTCSAKPYTGNVVDQTTSTVTVLS